LLLFVSRSAMGCGRFSVLSRFFPKARVSSFRDPCLPELWFSSQGRYKTLHSHLVCLLLTSCLFNLAYPLATTSEGGTWVLACPRSVTVERESAMWATPRAQVPSATLLMVPMPCLRNSTDQYESINLFYTSVYFSHSLLPIASGPPGFSINW